MIIQTKETEKKKYIHLPDPNVIFIPRVKHARKQLKCITNSIEMGRHTNERYFGNDF